MSDLRALARGYISALLDDGFVLVGADPGRLWLVKGNEKVVVANGGEAGEAALSAAPGLKPAGLVVFGGPEALRGQVEETKGKPAFILAHFVDDDGRVTPEAKASFRWARRLAELEALPEVDDESFSGRIAQEAERAQGLAEEQGRFQQIIGRRRPVVTWALLAVIVVFFGLEMLWGGAESVPTLVRMGALLRWPALDGQWWRLGSSVFLHGGFMHAAFNSYVLVAIGLSIERILGSRRFLLLFVLSGLGGGLASAFLLSEGFSVGASGAIWGLLGAEAVLAYRPAGLLPAAVLPQLKKAAMINLGINVLNSFRPQVDWAAHFGGGVVGALLIFTGALTLGLPKLGEVQGEQIPEDRPPAALWPLVVLFTGALAVATVCGPLLGEPWTLRAPPELAPVRLAAAGLTVDVPTNLERKPSEALDVGEVFVAGEMLADPAVVELFAGRHEAPLAEETLDAELDGLEKVLKDNLPPKVEAVGTARRVSEPGQRLLFARYTFPNGLNLERGVILSTELVVRVDLLVWPDFYEGLWAGTTERMVRSSTITGR